MTQVSIQPCTDAADVYEYATEQFVRLARIAIDEKGCFTVALSGGNSPRGLFERLAHDYAGSEQLDWSRVEVFWSDERAVPPDHVESNFRLAHELLLRHVAIPPAQIHRMRGESDDLDRAAREYQEEIARVFGVSPEGESPSFDLILLGLGPDGHTASLFPGTAALVEENRWVVANRVPQLHTTRLTFTTRILNRAACVIFIVIGADKAAAVEGVFESASAPVLPAQLVRPLNGQLVWLLDAAAAMRMTHEGRRGAESE